jgi:broad specificity phosphatase PhoE
MIALLRHGRTEANASGLLLGRADPVLDPEGLRQAELAAEAIGDVDLVVSSPLQRTRETADFFDAPIEVDERWIELDYGEWDERPVADVTADEWAQWRRDVEFAPPAGESLASLGRRVRSAMTDLAERAKGERVVVVTHVSPIKAAVAHVMDAGDGATWKLFVAQASITRLRVAPGGFVLEQFNDVSHYVDRRVE